MEKFLKTDWFAVSESDAFDLVLKHPSSTLNAIIEKTINEEKINLPEFILRTVFAIQKVDYPGDDFEEPEDTQLTQEPPQKIRKIKKKSQIKKTYTKEEKSIFKKNMLINGEKKGEVVAKSSVYYLKIGGSIPNAGKRDMVTTIEVGQVVYLWQYTFPCLILGFITQHKPKESVGWKVACRPLNQLETQEMNEIKPQSFSHPNSKAGSKISKAQKQIFRTSVTSIIYILDGVLAEAYNNQAKIMEAIIPKVASKHPRSKKKPKGERKNEEPDYTTESDDDLKQPSAAEVFNFPPLFFIQFPEKKKFLQKSSTKL